MVAAILTTWHFEHLRPSRSGSWYGLCTKPEADPAWQITVLFHNCEKEPIRISQVIRTESNAWLSRVLQP
jgi:hypothetical protein